MALIPDERLIVQSISEDCIREGRLATSDFDRSLTFPEPQPYINRRINCGYNAITEGDLTFVEMKIENKNEYMIVNMVYIDKSTYEEVTRTYRCSVSLSKENYYSLSSDDSSQASMNIKLENMGSYTETRKQL